MKDASLSPAEKFAEAVEAVEHAFDSAIDATRVRIADPTNTQASIREFVADLRHRQALRHFVGRSALTHIQQRILGG